MRPGDAIAVPCIGPDQVLWAMGGDANAMHNEAELRLDAAKSLAQAFCLVDAHEGGTEILAGAMGALHVLMSDAMALYEAAHKSRGKGTRPPPQGV